MEGRSLERSKRRSGVKLSRAKPSTAQQINNPPLETGADSGRKIFMAYNEERAWGKPPMGNEPIIGSESICLEKREQDCDGVKIRQISTMFRDCHYAIQGLESESWDTLSARILLNLVVSCDGGKTFIAAVENHLKNKV